MSGVISQVLGHQVRAAARSRWLAVYTGFFALVTGGLLRYGGGGSRTTLSLLSIVLFVLPLVALVLGTVYQYNAREFTELLLAQPVSRRRLFAGLYGGVAIPLCGAFVVGVGVPRLLMASPDAPDAASMAILLGVGVALTLLFTALAFVIALRADDRLRGLGIAIGVWLLLALVYDGAVLALTAIFADYALERPMLAVTFANPIDLARVLVLLRLDVSALMGYTGAVFQKFFGGGFGIAAAAAGLAAWIIVPTLASARVFCRKDF